MCIVHSTLRDATTPYTGRWQQAKQLIQINENSNNQIKNKIII